jgi:hypothetical protein
MADVVMTIQNCVNISGSLIVDLTNSVTVNNTLEILKFTCILGTFESVTVLSGDNCLEYSATPIYSSNSLSLFLTKVPRCDGGFPSWGYGIIAFGLVVLFLIIPVSRWLHH